MSQQNSLIPPTPAAADYAAGDGRERPDAGLDGATDPVALFASWLAAAREREINDCNAMSLATVDGDGLPDVRVVLLKDFDARGFTFFTNYDSAKSAQLAGAGKAALGFHWKSLRRQVRARGLVERASEAESDAYFATRARESQIGAWASRQSHPLSGTAELVAAVAEVAARFEGQPVPRPPFWGGWRLVPQTVEFWNDGAFRLHERLVFTATAGGWTRGRLYP